MPRGSYDAQSYIKTSLTTIARHLHSLAACGMAVSPAGLFLVQVADGLYVSGAAVAQDRAILAENSITHVVNCVGALYQEYFKNDGIAYKTLWLQGERSQDNSRVQAVAVAMGLYGWRTATAGMHRTTHWWQPALHVLLPSFMCFVCMAAASMCIRLCGQCVFPRTHCWQGLQRLVACQPRGVFGSWVASNDVGSLIGTGGALDGMRCTMHLAL